MTCLLYFSALSDTAEAACRNGGHVQTDISLFRLMHWYLWQELASLIQMGS